MTSGGLDAQFRATDPARSWHDQAGQTILPHHEEGLTAKHAFAATHETPLRCWARVVATGVFPPSPATVPQTVQSVAEQLARPTRAVTIRPGAYPPDLK